MKQIHSANKRCSFAGAVALVSFILLGSALPASAQNPSLLWDVFYGGASKEYLADFSLHNNGYIATGYTTPSDDGLVFKGTDSALSGMWLRSCGGTGLDRLYSIQPTPGGGYIAAGYTASTDGDISGKHSGGADAWVLKLDDTGAVQWSKCYGGTAANDLVTTSSFASDAFYSIRPLPGGGYLAAGYTRSDDGDVSGKHSGGADAWIVRLDDTGALLWQHCYGGTAIDARHYPAEAFQKIRPTADGGFIAVGFTSSGDGDVSGFKGGRDYWAVKIDSAGAVQWQHCYGGSKTFSAISSIMVEAAYDVLALPDGYAIIGDSRSTDGDVSAPKGGGPADMWLVRTDTAGSLLWEKSYGGTSQEFGRSISATIDGGFLLGGGTGSNDGDLSGTVFKEPHNSWLLKTDAQGTIQWQWNDLANNNPGTIVVDAELWNIKNFVMAATQLPDGSVIAGAQATWPIPRKGNPPASGGGDLDFTVYRFSSCPAYSYVTDSFCKGSTYTFDGRQLSLPGIYWDTLINASGCDSLVSLTLVQDSVIKPMITASGNVLSTGAYATYQWLDASGIIPGAASASYTAVAGGPYRVVAGNLTGCTDTSGVYLHTPTVVHEADVLAGVSLYPNPAQEKLYLHLPAVVGAVTLDVYTVEGKPVQHQALKPGSNELSLSGLVPGMYLLHISTGQGSTVRRVLKQ